MEEILRGLDKKVPASEYLDQLLDHLSPSELNSFILELFRRQTATYSPARVLKQFTENRFVQPATVDPIAIKQMEIDCLELLQSYQYETVLLSPVAPLGSCSVMGKTDQNKIVSALRGTEVVADATNVIALKLAQVLKQKTDRSAVLRYATTHRHIRAQYFSNPSFKAHFTLLCLVSGAFDRGNFQTEWQLFSEHLSHCYQLLNRYFKKEELRITFFTRQPPDAFVRSLESAIASQWSNWPIIWSSDSGTPYYEWIQFKIYLLKNGQAIDLADGGFTDWTQLLLSNRKHRLFTSGIGLERMLQLSSK